MTSSMMRGLVNQFAPGIAQGALVELLRHQKVDVNMVIQWVQDNSSLWNLMGQEDRDHLKALVSQVSDISWITPDWAINAIRKDLPGVASLFLGWTKAKNWLDRQIEEIKRELAS